MSTQPLALASMHYSDALKLQQAPTLKQRGRFLVFMPSTPIVTIGRRYQERLPDGVWRVPGAHDESIAVLATTRGGGVSFHVPGQWLVFPIGGLVDFGYESTAVKAFIDDVILVFKEYIENTICKDSAIKRPPNRPPLTYQRDGIFSEDASRKFLSVGLRVQRSHMEHGFCLNMWPTPVFNDWSDRLIVCDAPQIKLSALYAEQPDARHQEALACALLHKLDFVKKPTGTTRTPPEKPLEP